MYLQAEKILHHAATWNGKVLTEENKNEISRILDKVANESKTASQSTLNILHMFAKKNLKKTLIILLNWITTCLGAYTLMLNVVDLSGDLFLNFILMALFGDIPGIIALLVTMKYFGRRFNLCYMQALLGICCLVLAFIPKSVSSLLFFFFLTVKINLFCSIQLEYWSFS